jgi:hypothetical protein
MLEYMQANGQNVCSTRYCFDCAKKLQHTVMDAEQCGVREYSYGYYEVDRGDLTVDLCAFCADEDEEEDDV